MENSYNGFDTNTLDFTIEKAEMQINDHIQSTLRFQTNMEKIGALSAIFLLGSIKILFDTPTSFVALLSLYCVIITLIINICFIIWQSYKPIDSVSLGFAPNFLKIDYFCQNKKTSNIDIRIAYLNGLDRDIEIFLKSCDHKSKMAKYSVLITIFAMLNFVAFFILSMQGFVS